MYEKFVESIESGRNCVKKIILLSLLTAFFWGIVFGKSVEIGFLSFEISDDFVEAEGLYQPGIGLKN